MMLKLIRAGKMGAGFLRWLGGVIIAVVATLSYFHLKST